MHYMFKYKKKIKCTSYRKDFLLLGASWKYTKDNIQNCFMLYNGNMVLFSLLS